MDWRTGAGPLQYRGRQGPGKTATGDHDDDDDDEDDDDVCDDHNDNDNDFFLARPTLSSREC